MCCSVITCRNFTEKVTHEYQQSRSNKFEVGSGFYTDQMMIDQLKFSKPFGNTCFSVLMFNLECV